MDIDEGALAFAQQYSNQDVSSALGFRNRGASKHALERYEEAITDYTKSIELDPNVADTFICRARAFLKIGSMSDAFDDASHAYKARSNNHCPENYIRLSAVFKECKKYDLAIKCINQYLRHVEEIEYYRNEYGDLWAEVNGLKSTGFSTTGNIIEVDWLEDAEIILKSIQQQLKHDDKQQKLFPCPSIDELKNNLSFAKENVSKAIKRLKVLKND